MTDWFAPSFWVGGNPFGASDYNYSLNSAAQAANAGAVAQQSAAAAAPTGYNPVYNSPVAFGDYNYGTVGGYPSFGEASYGGGGGGGTGTPSTAEQPFSPSGGGGGYDPGGGSYISYDINGNPTTMWGGGYHEGNPSWMNSPMTPDTTSTYQQGAQGPNFADLWANSGGRYPNSGYTPQVAAPPASQPWDIWPQGNAIWDPVYGDGSGGGGNDLIFDGVSFVRGGGGGGGGGGYHEGNPSWMNAMNQMGGGGGGSARDNAAWALMAQQPQWQPQYQGGGGIGSDAARAPAANDYFNPLYNERQPYANQIRNDPAKSLDLAARLYSEDQNNPDTRVAILESMLNAQTATGRDPFDLSYYPKDTQQYRDAYNKLSGDNELLNQIHQEMEQAWGGSNISNYATDWGSGSVAETGRRLGTPTWLSPTQEQFYRKDISNDWAGAGTATQIQRWLESVRNPNSAAYPSWQPTPDVSWQGGGG